VFGQPSGGGRVQSHSVYEICMLSCCRYADKANMEVGLLFTCRLGNVDLDRPVGERSARHLQVPYAKSCWTLS